VTHGTSQPSYFDSAYRDYQAQNPPAKLDHYLDVIRARVHRSRLRLLDLGCGPGLFLQRAQVRLPTWELSGIDVHSDTVGAASALVPEASIRLGRADAIPHPDASFDVVTAWDVLEHLENPELALSEIKRCLTHDGILALVVPVYDGITGPLTRLLDRDPTHLRKESRSYWIDLLERQFAIVEWHGVLRFMVTRSIYIHQPTRLLRRSTPAIVLIARRQG
jgi:ubiquinone/menaquinone biosynthesis C-methylase UbiE